MNLLWLAVWGPWSAVTTPGNKYFQYVHNIIYITFGVLFLRIKIPLKLFDKLNLKVHDLDNINIELKNPLLVGCLYNRGKMMMLKDTLCHV